MQLHIRQNCLFLNDTNFWLYGIISCFFSFPVWFPCVESCKKNWGFLCRWQDRKRSHITVYIQLIFLLFLLLCSFLFSSVLPSHADVWILPTSLVKQPSLLLIEVSVICCLCGQKTKPKRMAFVWALGLPFNRPRLERLLRRAADFCSPQLAF